MAEGWQLAGPVTLEQGTHRWALRGADGVVFVAGLAPPGLPLGTWAHAHGEPGERADEWILSTSSGRFSMLAPGLRVHKARPGVLEPLVAAYAATGFQAWLGRALVRLLRVPGLVRLLVRWHARRTRPKG